MASVSIEDGNKEAVIGNVYLEPTGEIGAMLSKLEEAIRSKKEVVLGEANGMAGEKQPHAPQRGRGPPTFETVNGKSWIDLTITTMGVEVIEWEVLSQDLLSDHRGIHVRLGNDQGGNEAERRREATRYSKRGADWEKFERSVRESVEEGPQTEESEGQWWQEVCCKTAEGAFSIRRKSTKRKNKEWWDEDLRKARAKANKSRREAQGEREAGARERKMAQYRGERKSYKDLIIRKKQEYFRKFCKENSSQDPWGKAYRIWRGQKTKGGGMENTRKSDGSWTASVDETVEALFDKYFPGNETENDREEEEAGEVPEDGTEDPYFTARETREPVWAFGQDKAPGGDGFPTWALRRVLRIARQMGGNIERMPGERRISRSLEEGRGDMAAKTERGPETDKPTAGSGKGAGQALREKTLAAPGGPRSDGAMQQQADQGRSLG
ncbi:hypothetical protein Trydic_g10118 [Trypoxylus dichotomus]